jgi:hypothetical protein
MKKVLFAFVTVALAVASAASNVYHITLAETAWVGGTQLKPGDYKIEMDGNKALIKMGKNVVEAPAKAENGNRKYESTSIQIDGASGKARIEEIHVGGTTTKITFERGASAVE